MIGGMLFLPLSWEIYDPGAKLENLSLTLYPSMVILKKELFLVACADRSTRNLRSFCESVRRVYADEEVVVLSEIFPHRECPA